ncbi:hypothetical protein Lser_V15G38503 [Lactuca serriola]
MERYVGFSGKRNWCYCCMGKPVVDAEYQEEIEKARRDLRALIFNKTCAPIMLRLAFHDAGTYCKHTQTGGPNGSIRKPEEFEQSCNKGLKVAIDFCEEIKSKHPKISYADIFQLAGVVAVGITGGPTIDFIPGRKDSNECTEEGRLPDLEKGPIHLMDTLKCMGLCYMDFVALSGAHVMDRTQKNRSNFDGPWTDKPLKFDNSYFINLLREYREELVWHEPQALVRREFLNLLIGESDGTSLIPSDRTMMTFDEFRCDVMKYAEIPELFLKEYAQAHKKLSELGFIKKPPFHLYHKMKKNKKGYVLPQTIAGVIIAASIIMVWYRVKEK